MHQVRDWYSGAAGYFGWMREAKREHCFDFFDRCASLKQYDMKAF